MTREQLEHILRAGGAIVECQDLVIIGSQAILGAFPKAPAELLTSMEADVFPLDAPERADLIDGTIGELSPFHETFGYYAHGVTIGSATLATGWRDRLVKLVGTNTGGVSGWCLSPVDLAISKLCAGRDKDFAFVHGLLQHRLVLKSDIAAVGEAELSGAHLAQLRQALSRL